MSRNILEVYLTVRNILLLSNGVKQGKDGMRPFQRERYIESIHNRIYTDLYTFCGKAK